MKKFFFDLKLYKNSIGSKNLSICSTVNTMTRLAWQHMTVHIS